MSDTSVTDDANFVYVNSCYFASICRRRNLTTNNILDMYADALPKLLVENRTRFLRSVEVFKSLIERRGESAIQDYLETVPALSQDLVAEVVYCVAVMLFSKTTNRRAVLDLAVQIIFVKDMLRYWNSLPVPKPESMH